jgi:hypothetical protein
VVAGVLLFAGRQLVEVGVLRFLEGLPEVEEEYKVGWTKPLWVLGSLLEMLGAY